MAMAGTFLAWPPTALEEARKLSMRRITPYRFQPGPDPVLHIRLGTLWGMLERTPQASTYHAAANFDAGEPDALMAVMAAKVEVADCAVAMVNDASAPVRPASDTVAARVCTGCLRDPAPPISCPHTDILRVWDRSCADGPASTHGLSPTSLTASLPRFPDWSAW